MELVEVEVDKEEVTQSRPHTFSYQRWSQLGRILRGGRDYK